MNLFDGIPADAWMEARVEAYLDGDLPTEEHARFEHCLLAAPAWREDVLLAGQIREGLRALPLPACPPGVTRTVLRQARREARTDWLGRLTARLEDAWGRTWQPALAMAVLALLVVVAALVGRLPEPPPPGRAEVEHALEEVKWTLAFLSDFGRRTGRTVRREGFEPGLIVPMHQALDTLVPRRPE